MNNKHGDLGLKPVIETKHPRWRKYANCKNASIEMFIVKKGHSLKPALALCATCLVSKACLDFALDNNCVGIWGNTTQKQREKIKRQQELKEQQN